MAPSACCLFLRRPLYQKQTTTCGRELEFSECVDGHHVLKKIIDLRCDSTFAITSERPALICKAIETVITKNEMVEQPDAEQVAGFPQSCGERPILRARIRAKGSRVFV